ncbi:hypothetical protein CRE_01467 [Caenorhabditis remanei]|uniref:Uncharacterized protein n=1 Tax=Caenorhabditis remanei TaxID=31234 RepID=E3NPG3_CAERE|nr:hypothetical protein CRE_01467 [Caenorhabditis remanei]
MGVIKKQPPYDGCVKYVDIDGNPSWEGLPQILQVKAAKLVEEAEENNEEWEELENLCKLAVEEREDQRKHLLIAVKSKIEMFREIHEASEEVVPPPPLSPQQVLHIMAESIDAPNQEPVVTSPMKYPLYHELHMANSTGMIGNNSELSPETHQLPERIQDLNLNGTLEKQTTAADTPILNSNCHINPELGGLPTGNIVYQPVNMRQKGRQNINENSNYPAAAGFSQSNMNSQSGHVRGNTRNNLNNIIGQPRFEYSEENQQNNCHERNFNGNEHSEHYQQQQIYNRMRYSEYPDHQNTRLQYQNQPNQTHQSQGNWNNQQIPYKRCEVCNGDHEITFCNQNDEVVARVCIKIGICPKCRAGGHQVSGCPLLYLEKEQARMNREKNHEESRNRNHFNDQESNRDNRNFAHQLRVNNQPRYAERKNEILEKDLARHVANIKPFTGIISEYASFRNIMAEYLESETVSLVVRRDTLMQKISGEAAVQKSILDDPGKAIDITMKNLDRAYKRKGSTTIRNQFEKVIVTDENIDAFIKSLALSKSLHDKILEEEPHGFGYHSIKALLGRMPDAVRRMCNRMLRDETLSTEKIYEKAEEHLDNQIEDAEITGKSTNQTRVSRDQQH